MGEEETPSGYVGVGYQKTKGSDTSKRAAQSVAASVGNQRARAWEFIYAAGALGATAQEANAAMGIKHNCCSRFTELRQLGRIRRSGFTRKTVTGRQADVHVAVEPIDWTDQRDGWPTPIVGQTRRQTKLEIERYRVALRAINEYDRQPGSMDANTYDLYAEIRDMKAIAKQALAGGGCDAQV